MSPIVSVAVSAGISLQRIKSLEKTVDKHNKFAERIPALEADISNLKEEIHELKKR